jgi:hypothetical protein
MSDSPEDRVSALLQKIPLLELLRFVPMSEAARLSGRPEDFLRQHHQELIKNLSPGCDGMRVIDVLTLPKMT